MFTYMAYKIKFLFGKVKHVQMIKKVYSDRECLLSLLTGRAHWDFLTKFLSFRNYTTLEGVLCVQRSRQAQGTTICLLGLLFFRQNGMTFKKPTKVIKIQ